MRSKPSAATLSLTRRALHTPDAEDDEVDAGHIPSAPLILFCGRHPVLHTSAPRGAVARSYGSVPYGQTTRA